MKFKIKRRKYNTKGSLAWEYNPLRNLEKTTSEKNKILSDFDTGKLTLDINHPIDIECRTSYDGSTDIIFNDDTNPPRIVNSSFTVKEDNSFVRVSRNQKFPTNIYREDYVEEESRLQKTTSSTRTASESDSTVSEFLYFDFKEISGGGSLKGGNYVFLAQYSDDDDNLTRVVSESGIVSVFAGHLGKPRSMYSTLMHENAGKMIRFNLCNLDESFSKVYISYRRDFCDLNGIKQTEYKKIVKPYRIKNIETSIIIDGREQVEDISYDKLIESVNIYSKVKTQAQTQNMLFFGNVEETYDDIKTLQSLALGIRVKPVFGKDVGMVDQNLFEPSSTGAEYFNTHNIYDNLGYMPEEFYRLGVVFIYNDDSRSSVYNLRGNVFTQIEQWNYALPNESSERSVSENIDLEKLFIRENSMENTKGVFRMPNINLYASDTVTPILLEFSIPTDIAAALIKLNIKGYYYVRQNRIPIFLAQGFSIGVSNSAYIPMLSTVSTIKEETEDGKESLLNSKKVTFGTDGIFVRDDILPTETKKNGKPKKNKSGQYIHLRATRTEVDSGSNTRVGGLLCPDAIFNKQLQSMLSGTKCVLRKVADYQSCNLFYRATENDDTDYDVTKKINLYRTETKCTEECINRELVFIPQDSPYRAYKNRIFSTKSGSVMDLKSMRSVSPVGEDDFSFKVNSGCVRGNYTPFIGVLGCDNSDVDEVEPNTVYNIYSDEYGNSSEAFKNAITLRAYNQSEFTTICDPRMLKVSKINPNVKCARGDCFTCTSQHKFSYNFLDPSTPLNETMVKGYIQKGTKGKRVEDKNVINQFFEKTIDQVDATAWQEWNVSDANVVDIGHYVSMKYMSNFNNIRAVDTQHIEEISLYGSPRQFFPLAGATRGVAFKIPDSTLVNYGLSSSRMVLPHFEALQIPFVNNNFDNRIAFSNISNTSSFSNGYRVFSGLSYQDIERTYGAIVKLIPLGQNLFCVFEHGCGIIPVNEKALMSTTSGQSIHLYGTGVLQEQITVVSQDYGSTWKDSIVVSPDGIYGVDTWAKKIWRYNARGFELISDQLVQKFLNDNLKFKEKDVSPTLALKNVKAHYNNYKGDVMFTFYKGDECCNICYNERIGKFTTRYSWSPLLSENIQNSFITINKQAVEPYAYIAENQVLQRGLVLIGDPSGYCYKYERSPKQYNSVNFSDDNVVYINENTCKFSRVFKLKGYEPCNSLMAHVKSVTYSEWDDINKKEIIHTVTNDTEHGFWIDPHNVKVSVPVNNSEEVGKDETVISGSDGSLFVEKITSSKTKASVIGWGDLKTPLTLSELQKNNFVISDSEYFLEEDTGDFDEDETDISNLTNFKAKWTNYVACHCGRNLGVEIKLDKFVSWIKIQVEVSPMLTTLHIPEDEWGTTRDTCNSVGDSFTQVLYFVSDYDFIKDKISSGEDSVKNEYYEYKNIQDNTLRVGFYTHGRAGIHDELDYKDQNPNNQIKPTFWYNKQEPFEFEFVVNTMSGMQKIFNNLVLISNNAEPELLEISIVGDAYGFNKSGIFNSANTVIEHNKVTGVLDLENLRLEKLKNEFKNSEYSQNLESKYMLEDNKEIVFNTTVSKDHTLNQYLLNIHEDCRNVKDWGKRLGNIEYKEDRWLVTLSPIMFKNTKPVYDGDKIINVVEGNTNSARIRDKWCKIRIKYKGDKLVVISAIQTFMSLSFS